MIGKLIQVATAIAKKFAGQLGVAEEAIGPFPVETCSTMLVTAEGLVNQAKAKLADADIFTV